MTQSTIPAAGRSVFAPEVDMSLDIERGHFPLYAIPSTPVATHDPEQPRHIVPTIRRQPRL
jgi:hypothetical protein